MSATKLLADLRAAGLNVVEEPGWKKRGWRWRVDGEPEGVMQHHTAPPNPFPIKKLYGPPTYFIKANMATWPDGRLFLIAYKACNYSSGYGMLSVLTQNVRKSIAPTRNATKRGAKGGNKHFWNYENSHPGDGSPIPQVQLDTIIVSTQVVIDHFGMDPEQIISHAEWTRRKIDPYWNGSNRTAINQIREGAAGTPPVVIPPSPPSDDWTTELIMALPTLRRGDGFSNQNPQLRDDVRRIQANVAIAGIKAANTFDPVTGTPDGLFGPGTEASIRAFQTQENLTSDGIVGEDTWTSSLGQ